MIIKVAVSGLGNVGRGLLGMWDQLAEWAGSNGVEPRLVAAVDSSAAVINADGIDASALLHNKLTKARLSEISGSKAIDAIKAIDETAPDVFVDMTPTNSTDGEPGMSCVMHALEAGACVVVSSKNHLRSVEAMDGVERLARQHSVAFFDGASVMGGVPVFELADGINAKIFGIRAILNGTSNYVLCQLESMEFDDAIASAIRLGYAEAEYGNDISGRDSALKAVGLCNRLLGAKIPVGEVKLSGIREGMLGIEGVDSELIRRTVARGRRIKLVCSIRRDGPAIRASVGPEFVDMADPLASVSGINNAIEIRGMANQSEISLFLSGPGAGGDVTASRVAADIKKAMRFIRASRRG